MAITTNVAYAPQTVGTTDTVVILPLDPILREAVSKFWVENTDLFTRCQVDVYVSPNNSSASGDLVQRLDLAPASGKPCDGLIGYSVPQDWRVIVRATVTGAVAFISTTQFTPDT